MKLITGIFFGIFRGTDTEFTWERGSKEPSPALFFFFATVDGAAPFGPIRDTIKSNVAATKDCKNKNH